MCVSKLLLEGTEDGWEQGNRTVFQTDLEQSNYLLGGLRGKTGLSFAKASMIRENK
jgi:hypothetical protein